MMDSGRFSAALRGLVVAVWGEGVSTLHCPRPRLELAGLMRKVVNHTAKTLTQVWRNVLLYATLLLEYTCI